VKVLLIIAAVVVVGILLIPPSVAYASFEGKPDYVSITATASSPGPSYKSTLSADFQLFNEGRPGFVGYIGSWWGSLFKPGAVTITYPCVSVVITVNNVRAQPDEYYPYSWGVAWSHNYELAVEAGDHVMIQVQIYSAQSISNGYIHQEWTVPG